MSPSPALALWVDQLQSEGRYTFTRSQAETETGRSFVAAQTALRRLKEKGRIVSPRRGFYAVVPPEYRATGSPPASWFIDALMTYLGQPYYVALLSAAAIHGAAHQQPMVLQVVTSKSTREILVGKVAIRFSMCRQVELMPVAEKQTETGTMRVSTPETTAFDLVRYQAGAGHLNNAATVLAELADRIDPQALANVAALVRTPDVQRLGYLLEALGRDALAGPLANRLGELTPRAIPLCPGERADAEINERWHVRVNVDLEVDL